MGRFIGMLPPRLQRLVRSRVTWMAVLAGTLAAACSTATAAPGGGAPANTGAPAVVATQAGSAAATPSASAVQPGGLGHQTVAFTAAKLAQVKAAFAAAGCSTAQLPDEQPPGAFYYRGFVCQWPNGEDQADYVVSVYLFNTVHNAQLWQSGVASTNPRAQFFQIEPNVRAEFYSAAKHGVFNAARQVLTALAA